MFPAKQLCLSYIFVFATLFSVAQTGISRLEYYIDTDPGYGKGISVPIATSQTSADVSFTIDFSSLSPGVHIIYVRTQDTSGKWSFDNRFIFTKFSVPVPGNPVPALSRTEYYIDKDPGYGNGISVPIAPGPINGNGTFQVEVTSLDTGSHNIFIRTKDANGKWSLDNKFAFNISRIPTLKYFRDADNDTYGNKFIDSIATSQPLGYVLDSTDCNDTDRTVHPGAVELCDGKDNNCDGIVDNNSPALSVTGDTLICLGTTLTLTANGGTSYEWTGPQKFTASTAAISVSNIDTSRAGVYSVIIRGGAGCIDTLKITNQVFVISPPKAVVNGLKNAYCLNDSSSLLSGLPSGGIFKGAGISGNTYTPSVAGTSIIQYISPSYYGCPVDTAKRSIMVNGLPSVTISSSGSFSLCARDSLILSASSTANSFLWNTGANYLAT